MAKLKKLPAPYEEVRQQMITLHAIWKIYRQLYETSEARVKLLNRAIPSFGWLMQRVLADAIILAICRLCEQGKPVTIPKLVASLKTIARPEESKEMREQLKAINATIAPLKEHRDKRICHNTQLIGQKPEKNLPAVTRKAMRKSIAEMVNLMGDIHQWFLDYDSHYDPSMLGDGDALIYALQRAERWHELRLGAHTLTREEMAAKLLEPMTEPS